MAARKEFIYLKKRLRSRVPIIKLKDSIELEKELLATHERILHSLLSFHEDQTQYYDLYDSVVGTALQMLRHDISVMKSHRYRRITLIMAPFLLVIVLILQYLSDLLTVVQFASTLGFYAFIFTCVYLRKIEFSQPTYVRYPFSYAEKGMAKELGVI
jgi:hypothetical protein